MLTDILNRIKLEKKILEYKTEINFLIIISLFLLSLKCVFLIIFQLFFLYNSAFNQSKLIFVCTYLFIFIFLVVQIFGVVKKYQWTWIFSAIQVLFIIAFSEGTFSYLFLYVFKPFSDFQPFYSYFISSMLILSEVLKTSFLFKSIKS